MDTTGLIVVAAVLVLGTAAGLWRRRADGRLRSVKVPAAATAWSPPGAMPPTGEVSPSAGLPPPELVPSAGPAPLAGELPPSELPPSGVAHAGGVSASDVSPSGGVSPSGASSSPGGVELPSDATGGVDPSAAGQRIDPDLLQALGVGPASATLLQFSSAFCAPCRSVRRISSEVAGLLPGVQHVEVDAESHLAAVRALGIWRTPTLLVLDAEGRVVKRATGVPRKPQLIAALADLLPAR
ncbi:thioredoxin domain-containing protein [Actinoplanes sp. NPDC026623]|uniref:TlpA family protein disulfide reductase n=1 Tax=Actinoplanes sp. NPDC026623 TaxID=3155610 RepID=UPI0034086CF2